MCMCVRVCVYALVCVCVSLASKNSSHIMYTNSIVVHNSSVITCPWTNIKYACCIYAKYLLFCQHIKIICT